VEAAPVLLPELQKLVPVGQVQVQVLGLKPQGGLLQPAESESVPLPEQRKPVEEAQVLELELEVGPLRLRLEPVLRRPQPEALLIEEYQEQVALSPQLRLERSPKNLEKCKTGFPGSCLQLPYLYREQRQPAQWQWAQRQPALERPLWDPARALLDLELPANQREQLGE
jgi:hypothetical protein